MTTKTRRVMKRKKRMEFRLVLAAVFCLLLVASFGKLRLQQKNETYQQQEEELLAQISEEEERTEEIEELKKYVQTKMSRILRPPSAVWKRSPRSGWDWSMRMRFFLRRRNSRE